MRIITDDSIGKFEQDLHENDKAVATIEKYVSAIHKLMEWLDGFEITHVLLMEYRDYLLQTHTVTTVNGVLSAVNSYLDMAGLPEFKMKLLKVQKKIFRSANREMTRNEYFSLIKAARKQGRERLLLIMETICSTGIRVSELEYITVEAIKYGYTEVTLKGKTRTIFIPEKMCEKLKRYTLKQRITSGRIFLTRNGTPISRKQIWAEMKSLCDAAGITATKVFPHNLRHLFAQCFYNETHDIVKLADMLGHSSVETTRIYLISSGIEHAKTLNNLRLVS